MYIEGRRNPFSLGSRFITGKSSRFVVVKSRFMIGKSRSLDVHTIHRPSNGAGLPIPIPQVKTGPIAFRLNFGWILSIRLFAEERSRPRCRCFAAPTITRQNLTTHIPPLSLLPSLITPRCRLFRFANIPLSSKNQAAHKGQDYVTYRMKQLSEVAATKKRRRRNGIGRGRFNLARVF